MTSTADAVNRRLHITFILCVFFMMLTGIACNKANDAPGNTKSAPANVAVNTKKPAEPEAKKDDAKKDDSRPAGKEIKPADGPKLKSITPVEGTILGGVLNEYATDLPPADETALKSSKEGGTVTVEVIVNEKGEVTTSSVVSGPTELWRAAGEAARKARFDPPLHDGKPTKVAGVLTYEFKK